VREGSARGKLSDRKGAISRGERRPREEVSVMEVYWQLILRAGCARFVGHDTLPSRRATGKPTRDVLRRPTESNARPPPLRFHPVDADPPLVAGAVRLCQSRRKCIVPSSTSGARETPISLIERI